MKKISKYILAIASVSVLFSCSQKEDWTPGEEDNANTYGVFFPSQDVATDHVLDPEVDPTVLTLTAKRTNSKGDITVPFVVSGADTVFVVDDIKFVDGQDETTFDVNFPKAEIGTKYNLTVQVVDEEYISKYSSNATSIDLSIIRVKWLKFSEGTMHEGWWGEEEPAEMWFYEAGANLRYCYIKDCFEYETVAAGGEYDPVNYYFWWNTKTNKIVVDGQYMGYTRSDGLQVWFGCNVGFLAMYYGDAATATGGKYSSWEDYVDAQGMTRAHYDGNGDFTLADQYFLVENGVANGRGFWDQDADVFHAKTDEKGKVFVRVDYDLTIKPGFSQKGVLPVEFKVGADIDSIGFVGVAGELTAVQIAKIQEAIEKGTQEGYVTDTCLVVKTFTEDLSFEATGDYTLIVNGYDADKVVVSETVVLNYVAADDAEGKPVDITAGLQNADKYTKQGINPNTTLEYYVYGSDLKDVKVAIYSRVDVVSQGYDAIVEDLLYEGEDEDGKPITYSLPAEVVDTINTLGYSGFIGKLLPGTEYYLFVAGSNGYEQKIVYANATTSGDPLPIYASYSYTDYVDELEPTKESLIGTWNLYATDLFGDLGMREYVGKAVIAASTKEDTGPDENGYKNEYLDITGLSGNAADKYKFDDTIIANLYAGCLYIPGDAATTKDGKINVYTLTPAGSAYNAKNGMYGVPVADGYIAIVPTANAVNNGRDYQGLAYYSGGFLSAYIEYLLVDPEKDDNGIAPTANDKKFVDFYRNLQIRGAVKEAKAGRPQHNAAKPSGSFNTLRTSVKPELEARIVKVSAKRGTCRPAAGKDSEPVRFKGIL